MKYYIRSLILAVGVALTGTVYLLPIVAYYATPHMPQEQNWQCVEMVCQFYKGVEHDL
jgi:hypothetical protein